MRCTDCGQWLMIKAVACSICKTLDEIHIQRGVSDAGINQREDIMLGVKETEKGDR